MKRMMTSAPVALIAVGILAGCSSDSMPDRAEIESGFDKIMEESGVIVESMDAQVQQIYERTRTCVVDAVNESKNVELGEAFASGDSAAEGSKKAAEELEKILRACTDGTDSVDIDLGEEGVEVTDDAEDAK